MGHVWFSVHSAANCVNVMQLRKTSWKMRPLALWLCYAISKGAGKMKKGKMKKTLIQVIPGGWSYTLYHTYYETPTDRSVLVIFCLFCVYCFSCFCDLLLYIARHVQSYSHYTDPAGNHMPATHSFGQVFLFWRSLTRQNLQLNVYYKKSSLLDMIFP